MCNSRAENTGPDTFSSSLCIPFTSSTFSITFPFSPLPWTTLHTLSSLPLSLSLSLIHTHTHTSALSGCDVTRSPWRLSSSNQCASSLRRTLPAMCFIMVSVTEIDPNTPRIKKKKSYFVTWHHVNTPSWPRIKINLQSFSTACGLPFLLLLKYTLRWISLIRWRRKKR